MPTPKLHPLYAAAKSRRDFLNATGAAAALSALSTRLVADEAKPAVHAGGGDAEGQAQPLEQSAAVGGGGTKDKRGGAGHECCQNNSQNKGLQLKAF